MIEREEHGDLVLLRMAHGKANAMDLELLQALREAIRAEHQGSCRGLVLTGTGNIFSAGVDLKRVLEGRTYLTNFLPALDEVMWALASFDKPLVAAVNGHAIAGGCVIACAADRTLCVSDGATIGAPELTVGVPFPTSALEMLRNSVPIHKQREVILQGTIYKPEGAMACGLVDELCDSKELHSRALKVAGRLAAINPNAYSHTKTQLWAEYWDRARSGDTNNMLDLWASSEVQTSIADYVERTLAKR